MDPAFKLASSSSDTDSTSPVAPNRREGNAALAFPITALIPKTTTSGILASGSETDSDEFASFHRNGRVTVVLFDNRAIGEW